MKKGWQKRLFKSAFKADFSIGYVEFLLQYAFWGIISFTIIGVVEALFAQEIFSILELVILFVAGLLGSSIAYYFKRKKN